MELAPKTKVGVVMVGLTVTMLDDVLTHCPVTCAVAVMLCPAVKAETFAVQFPEPFAVTGVCATPLTVTIMDALAALVPEMVVAPEQIGVEIVGAAVIGIKFK